MPVLDAAHDVTVCDDLQQPRLWRDCGVTEYKLNIVIITEDTKCVVTHSHVSGLSMRCTNKSFLFFIASGKISVCLNVRVGIMYQNVSD